MKLSKVLRMGVAAALVASVPMTASMAATRPGAAVPVTSAAAVQGTSQYRAGPSFPVLPVVVMVGTALFVAFIALDKDKKGSGALTRG